MEINIDKLFLIKELSDKKKNIDKELLTEFEIDSSLESIEIRKEVLELFESNKKALKRNLEDLTVQLMNLMQNFKSSSTNLLSAEYKVMGKNARLNLNGITNLKTEWNRKSMLLFG